jgi:hypothetical protein
MLNKTMKNGLQNTGGAIGHHDTQRKAGSCFFYHHYNQTGAGSCAQAGTTHRSMSLMIKNYWI